MSDYYKSLNDCGQKNWYKYKDSDKTNEVYTNHLVGYYSECNAFETYDCGKDFENIGYISHIGKGSQDFQPNEGSLAAESTNGNCSGAPDTNCKGFPHRQICRRNKPFKSTTGNGWTECCNSNTKLTVGPNDCHPLLYNENNKPSQRCVDICMQNSNKYKNITGGQTTTLKNDYLNGSCHDIIKSNKNESELREFCSKSPAWSNTTGPNASYSKICGCYYPDSYYENLKKIISDKTKIPEDMLGDKRCFSSLCSNSEMTNTNCPDLNILTCINNVNFNGNVNDSGNININQTNDCKQKYSDMSKGKSPGAPPGPPPAPGSPGSSVIDKMSSNTKIIIGIISGLFLLILFIGIIVAIKRKKLSNQMSTNIVPQLEN